MPHGDGCHHHAPIRYDQVFAISIGLNAAFVLAECGAGWWAGSVALLADAAHNLGDVFGLGLAWGATWLSRRRPSRRHTYGLGRSSILAALTNAIVLLISIGAIAAEAIRRLVYPEPSAGGAIIAVAALGIAVNGITTWILARDRHGDLNQRAAFVHMLADTAISGGVVAAGLVIWATRWNWVDPVGSLVIAGLLLGSTWSLLRQSLDMAMDAVPAGIDRDAVQRFLAAQPGITAVHDLHIWPLSTKDTALTAHLVRPVGDAGGDAFLTALQHDIRHRFGIGHATIQIERGDPRHPCGLEPDHVV